jgi:hypothetical protein
MEGSVIGSMQYIAPEQLEGSRRATPRADIFSFGCVLYEMLTGQRTFPEKNMAQLVTARMKNTYRPLSEFKVKCPRSLIKLVNACLTLNPDKRIATVVEILKRLEKIHAKLSRNKPEDLVEYYISSSTGKSTVAFRRPPPYKKTAIAVSAACLIVGIVCLIYPARSAIKGLVAGLWPAERSQPGKVPAARPPLPAVSKGIAGNPRHAPGGISLPALKPVDREKMQPSEEIQSGAVANIMSMPAHETWSAGASQGPADTGDPVAALAKKTEKGDYAGALRAFDALDRENAATVSARLYKLRALQGLGNKEALTAFFLRPDVPDKEYFLAKAQFFNALKRYVEAADQCDRGRIVPATIGDAAVLDRTLSYVKASCLTSQFMTAPTEEARKQAVDSWLEMKYLLRNNQGHPYFELADKNILLLSDQSKKTEP